MTRRTGHADTEPTATLIRHLRAHIARAVTPVIVGIDGRSGSGKTTLAGAVAEALANDGGPGTGVGTVTVTVIEGDDFYAGGSARTWDQRSDAERADRVIDWRRQRTVLEQLRAVGVGMWHPFDWDADDWDADDPPFTDSPVVAHAADLVVLEGAYSCRPELHDLLDLRVLLDVADDVRRQQLLHREGDSHRADWEERWATAEHHYFSVVMPPERFDLHLVPPAR